MWHRIHISTHFYKCVCVCCAGVFGAVGSLEQVVREDEFKGGCVEKMRCWSQQHGFRSGIRFKMAIPLRDGRGARVEAECAEAAWMEFLTAIKQLAVRQSVAERCWRGFRPGTQADSHLAAKRAASARLCVCSQVVARALAYGGPWLTCRRSLGDCNAS